MGREKCARFQIAFLRMRFTLAPFDGIMGALFRQRRQRRSVSDEVCASELVTKAVTKGERTSGAPFSGGAEIALSLPRGVMLLLAVLLLGAIGFRIWMSFQRFLDVDELEHLNASWFMSHGETIYGTFFENHPPILHTLLQPIVRTTDDAMEIIFRARGLVMLLALGCLAVVASIGRRLAGTFGALLAPLLLVSATYFFNEGLEVRPDVPACLFLLLSLLMLARDGNPRTFFWSGALLALAGLSTPKVIFAGSGAFLVAILWNGQRERATLLAVLRRAIMAVSGALVVCAIGAAILAAFGVLDGFIRDVLVTSARMTIDDVEFMRNSLLRDSLKQNPALWAAGVAGGLLVARQWWLIRGKTGDIRGRAGTAEDDRTGAKSAEDDRIRLACILLASWVTGFAGLFLIRAPLWQYYLTFLPQLALLATIACAALVFRAHRGGPIRAWIAAILLLASSLAPPALTLARFQPMGIEIDIMREVLAVTEPGDRVFDCWTGLYLTRMPAYRYFFLNADVQRLLDPKKMEADLLRMLDQPDVTAVILDDFVLELPIAVQNKIRRDFPDIQDFGILGLVWRERGGAEAKSAPGD